MTLIEAIERLPNGLHDAVLHRCSVDYAMSEAEFDVSLWIGLMGESEQIRERYALATLKLLGLQYRVIEPPPRRTIPGASRVRH